MKNKEVKQNMSTKILEITQRVTHTHTHTQVESRNSLGLVDIHQNKIDKKENKS